MIINIKKVLIYCDNINKFAKENNLNRVLCRAQDLRHELETIQNEKNVTAECSTPCLVK